MSTSDIHALSGAYAVDALDDIERAQFTRHLAQCVECQAEVAGLREAAHLLTETTATEPPAGLRDRLLAEIKTVRPLPPLEAAPAPVEDRRPERRRLRGLVAAAAAVAVVGTGGAVWHPWTDDSSQGQLPSATERVLDAPDAERVTQKLDGGVEATLVRSKSMNQAVLLTKNMPAAPSGKVYELWLEDAEKGMVPAGLLQDGASSVLLKGDAAEAIGAGITVEPQGGSDVPTSDPVMLFTFENA
jgi:anti-sigma factor RsiW